MRDLTTAWGTFRCFDGDAVGNALAEGRFWDAHLRPFMDEAATVYTGWAIDIGAYIGFHTVYLRASHPRHRPISASVAGAGLIGSVIGRPLPSSRAAAHVRSRTSGQPETAPAR